MPASRKRSPLKTNRRRTSLKTHSFTLIFSGAPEDLPDEFLDALYEAGCDDALIGTREGELILGFDRKAPSFRVALISAIADVEKAGVGVELIRVEPE